jgi:hypothetical protein
MTPVKEELEAFYLEGKSMFEISQILDCSVHKVVYWMEKYGIKRRNHSEASYLKLNPNGDPFQIKTELLLEEAYLFGLGIGIYWGEGDKRSLNALRVANSDVDVIKTFVRFLLEICRVEQRKLFYSIICFNDSNISDVKEYWSKMLKISSEKFGKIVQIPPQGKGTYRRKSQYGVCTVVVSNPKLKRWIMNEIDKLRA